MPRIYVPAQVVKTVPRLEVQEVIREVPKLELRTVEKLVEVPQVAFVEKFVEVPKVQVQEVLRHVPKLEVHEAEFTWHRSDSDTEDLLDMSCYIYMHIHAIYNNLCIRSLLHSK